MIVAQAVCDSVNDEGDRLFTAICRYPRFIHAQHLRHRAFSFSVSSSRALPLYKTLDEVRSDEQRAAPLYWGCEQRGMVEGPELDTEHIIEAKKLWASTAKKVAQAAWLLYGLSLHKSIINRLLEPFLHVNVIVTGTTKGWMNFFGLRLRDDAQPEMQILAKILWDQWITSKPITLKEGQWHLPFIDTGTIWNASSGIETSSAEITRKISAARCARMSYSSFLEGKHFSSEEDLKLYDFLVSAHPKHLSPLEHQATPNGPIPLSLGGNLGESWIQARKLISDEDLAPLPEGYYWELDIAA